MKHFHYLFMLAFVVSLPAAADIKGCFERNYDAGVLKRHPRQLVTSVILRSGVPPNDQEGFEDDVTFTLRGNKTIIVSSYGCIGQKNRLTCQLKDDGTGDRGGRGSFILTQTKDGVVMSPTTDLVLPTLGNEKFTTLQVISNPEHRTFTLKKTNVDLESCGAR
jgi:hypothetical protein